MNLSIFLFGIWETPVLNYWLFYIAFGLLGFLLCYFHRFFIIVVIPVFVWFAVSDFGDFYRYQVSPSESYVFQAFISMLVAMLMSFLGAYLNWKKLRELK